MIYSIFGIVLGLFFFIATIKAYTLGFKHGKAVSQGITPKLELSPIKTFKQYVEVKEKKKEQDLVAEGLRAIATYDPYEVKAGD